MLFRLREHQLSTSFIVINSHKAIHLRDSRISIGDYVFKSTCLKHEQGLLSFRIHRAPEVHGWLPPTPTFSLTATQLVTLRKGFASRLKHRQTNGTLFSSCFVTEKTLLVNVQGKLNQWTCASVSVHSDRRHFFSLDNNATRVRATKLMEQKCLTPWWFSDPLGDTNPQFV